MSRLTSKQRRLVRELHELQEIFVLDPDGIIREYERDSWTPRLEVAKNQLVRSQVVMWYTLTDEFLGSAIARFFFPGRRSFPQLWRTKRFRIFNHHVIEELSLLQKLRCVKAIRKMPKSLAGDIERLNSLRNGLVHAFFPENLKKSKPVWKGKNIFSVEGVQQLRDDMDRIFKYFVPGVAEAFDPKESQIGGAA